MKTVIVGAGEVGKSLAKVLSKAHEVFIRDKEITDIMTDPYETDVLNICYPPHKEFIETTKKYIARYQPKLTIIHSTVPVGTTRALGKGVVHSPIHGKHPDLAGGIQTFKKYVGGVSPEDCYVATQFLSEAGIDVYITSSPEASELSKIMCTSYYGWNILFMKEMARMCEEMNISFGEVYMRWNAEYNLGYEKLKMPWFKRPVLDPMPGGIGGHCVVNNAKLIDSLITNLIVAKDKEYRNDISSGEKCDSVQSARKLQSPRSSVARNKGKNRRKV